MRKMLNDAHISVAFVSTFILLTASQNGMSKDKCILPFHPEHGSYVIDGNPTAVPGEAFDIAYLNVSCQSGFSLVGKNFSLCIHGMWSDKLPECVRSCRLEKHPSVSYRCAITGSFLEDGYRDCNLNELLGTVVKPECNAPNYYSTGVLSYMRCTNDGWDYVAVCTPECGTVTSEGKEQLVGGRPVKHGELPWHAAIYTKSTTPFKQICGGSLVSTKVIISAAHCFWNVLEGKLHPTARYAVAVGKLHRPWGDPHDVNAQQSNISEIKVPSRFQGADGNFQDDIAVVTLSSTIVYQTYVRPVCLDFNTFFEKRQLQPGNLGKVAGWGLVAANGPPSPVLRVLDLPYVDIIMCIEEAPVGFKEYITSDKMCSGYKDGKAVCEGDSGGGLVFSANDRGIDRYYLRGIVSTAPSSDDACNTFAITSFTQVTAHRSFLAENTALFHNGVSNEPSAQANFCILPPYPKHGAYIVKEELNAYPGQTFAAVQLDVTCDPGYGSEENVMLSCNEGMWSDDVPRCIRLCKLDWHPSVEYRCLTNDKKDYRKCKEEELSGSTIKPECRAPFFSRVELQLMKCVDGSWDSNPTCRPGCGESSPDSIGGDKTPWTVVLYKKQKENPSCLGSLVSDTVVISVAQCVWDFVKSRPHPASDYSAAVGNLYLMLTDPRNRETQTSLVSDIKIPIRFRGRETNFQNDISILKLETPIKFTPQIQPVCVDYDVTFDRKQLQQGTVGKVSSMQYGAELTAGTLISFNMTYIDIELCLQTSEKSYRQFITADKICAKYESIAVCNGDSGGGLAIPDTDGRYYLRGVVSVTLHSKGVCTTNRSIGITHLQPHEHFVKDNFKLNYNPVYEYPDQSSLPI